MAFGWIIANALFQSTSAMICRRFVCLASSAVVSITRKLSDVTVRSEMWSAG
jgi:hypothetical protein